MKKAKTLFPLILLAAGLLSGCGGAAPEKEKASVEGNKETAFPVTVKDAAGKEIVIEESPEKIVSLIPSNTEIAYDLDLGDELAGVSDFDNYPEEAAEKEKVGGADFNVEKIIGLGADLVLAHGSSAHNAKEGFQQLEAAGIDVLVVNDAKNFEEVYESYAMIGKATGKIKEAEAAVAEIQADLAEVKEKVKSLKQDEKKKVYIEVSPAPELYTSGEDTFMQEMLTTIHAENINADKSGWIQITEEAVIQKKPDVIITTYGYYTDDAVKQVLDRKGWEDVPAIKNNEVHDVHSDIVTRTGPRLVEGVEELGKAIYPEVFAQ